MLGQEEAEDNDVDSLSLNELVISEGEDDNPELKCRNVQAPSNSPILDAQTFDYPEQPEPDFPEGYSPQRGRRNAAPDAFQLNNIIFSGTIDLDPEEVPSCEDTSSSVPATDSGISVSGISDEFPYGDLLVIDRMINSTGWKVPVEPGQELERLLKACLDLAKSDQDDENEACQKFYQESMTNSFLKVLTDNAVQQWSPETMDHIFGNTVTLVKLMALKVHSENIAFLKLMAIVFNPSSKFHHYNASRPSKTVPLSSQIPGEDVFARPTDFRAPKGFLIDLINHFGTEGGFQRLLEKFKSFENPPIDLIGAYLKPFGMCIELLTSSCIQSYMVPCTSIVTTYLENLSDGELKKETKVETRKDTLSGLIMTLKMILQRAPQDRKELIKNTELLRLQLLLRLIKCSSFNGKMNALNELNRVISPFLFNRRQAETESESVSSSEVAVWLKEQDILNLLLTDYLHLPQYVEKLDKILKFLIHENQLTTCDIDMIWDSQIDKHEAIVKNIHDLLAKLAWVLNPDALDAIFVRFQKSWETASRKAKEKLLELMGRLAEDDKEGVISDKVLHVLWLLITARDSATEIIDLALSTHIKILNYLYCNDKDKERLYWIEKCIQNIRHHHCVVASLKHLTEMCKLYSESHHGYGYVHKMKQLERDHTLIQLVINDTEHYLEQTRKVSDVESYSVSEVLPGKCYSHLEELKERLQFIRFTLKHANCYLSMSHSLLLWKHLTTITVFPSDMDIVFEWYGGLVGEDSDIESTVSKQLFLDKMMTLDPAAYTHPGLRCWEAYFKEVNENELKDSRNSQKLTDEEQEPFLGTDYIWRLVIEGKEELTEAAIALLKDIYSSVTVSHQLLRHNEFVKTCLTKARHCFKQYETQGYPLKLARQTIRILHVLREYVTENIDKGVSGDVSVPAHEKSWQGTPLILIAQLLGSHDKVVENIEVITHTNETFGAIRRYLLSHIYKNESPPTNLPHLELKLNGEELSTTLDRKCLEQLELKDKQVLVAKVVTSSGTTSSVRTTSSRTEDVFNNPCSPIKQMKHIPWLLYVSDSAMQHQHTELCNAVTAILNIFPTDTEIEEDIVSLAATQAAEVSSTPLPLLNEDPETAAIDSDLSTSIFLDSNCGAVQYKLEIVYALLLPAAPTSRSVKFRRDLTLAGGIEIVLSVLQHDRFLVGADTKTRRNCLLILAKISKFLLTALCCATLALYKKNNPTSRSLMSLQNSLISIPNPSVERVLRNAAHHTVQNENVLRVVEANIATVPTLQYIQAVYRLIWRCALGYPLYTSQIDKTTAPVSTADNDSGNNDALVKELTENLAVCFAHQPQLLESLLLSREFQEFVIDLVLICPSQFVRQVVSEQLYVMCVKCCVAGSSLLDVIKLLFDNLHQTEDYGAQSNYYFRLLYQILACAAHHNIIVCNSDSLLEQEVAWLRSIEHHNQFHPLDETLLQGHLQISRELVSISPIATKLMLGSHENGPRLLPSLLYNYLFPASKMLHDQRQFQEIEIRDDQPICQSPQTQEAAFNLIGALCSGCEENLAYVVTATKELFYFSDSTAVMWESPHTVHPRNPKGFVGLKNGGATCYMNAVLQQLFMIPQLRSSLLSLPYPELEEDEWGKLDSGKLHHLGVAKQVQAVFCALKESKHQYFTPQGFWGAFKLWGEPVNLREQHDSLEFFNALLDNLVEGTKALGQKPFIAQVLEGSFADQKICKGCPHRYTRIEPFLSISVDVRNHGNLTDSLDEFVKGDLLEGNNAYYCERCDTKVDTVKRLCFQKLPNVLAIQLKRFGYDWERECAVKYNDYFEFPDELSMERYTVDFLSRTEHTATLEMIESGDRTDIPTPSENSSYRLVGVVVHSGQASGGHYYSYIRQRVDDGSGDLGKWYRFDDVDVSESNIDQEGQMARLCYGGNTTESESSPADSKNSPRGNQKRWWNAYILFYERVDVAERTSVSDLGYEPPSSLIRQVRQDNLTFFHQRALYSSEFAQYVKHVVLPNVHVRTSAAQLETRDNSSEQITIEALDLLSAYLFQTGFQSKKSVRGRLEDWQEILLNLLQSGDMCRRWFASNYLFNTPNRFYQYLIECPMADVRVSFAFIIVTLAKLSAPDPPLSLSELNAWVADGYSYSMNYVAPLSLHIISGCFALIASDRVEISRNNQQLFHVFYCYMKGGLAEKQQLLQLGVHRRLLRLVLSEGYSTRGHDASAIHCAISALVSCIDLTSIRLTETGTVPVLPCPLHSTEILCKVLDSDTKQLLTGENYGYLRKVLEEAPLGELDHMVGLVKYICWENARASKTVLLELLYYISSIHSSGMKPYLLYLLHILLIQDSWQRKRIQLVLKGGPDRDTLLDIVQRSKSHHQKRAYQCMKCLTNLLTTSPLANEVFFEEPDNEFRWESAVNWLGSQLERRPGFQTSSPGAGWSPSNETGNDFYIERSNSAILVHQKAEALLPLESDGSESDTSRDTALTTDTSTNIDTSREFSRDSSRDMPDSETEYSRECPSDLETSRGSTGECDSSSLDPDTTRSEE